MWQLKNGLWKGGEKMKKLIVVIVTLAYFSLVAAGCSPARKPLPTNMVKPKTTTIPAPKSENLTATPRGGMTETADRVAREAARVKGVKSATVVVSVKTAFIGLALDSNVDKARTTAIKNQVASSVKSAETDLMTVNVTSDPDLTKRLLKVSDGIKKGQPVSSFASELKEIARRIVPQMK